MNNEMRSNDQQKAKAVGNNIMPVMYESGKRIRF